MLSHQIDRARSAANPLLGGPGVREFAAREFPREDLAWVVAQTRRPHPVRVSGRSVWRRLWGGSSTPQEPGSETEAITDPAPA